MFKTLLIGCLLLCVSASPSPYVSRLNRRHGGHEHSVCGEGADLSDYHVFYNYIALLVVLGFSFFGCGFAALAGRKKVDTLGLDLARHFGTGVILSTGFIHMLMGAIEHLSSECAPPAIRAYSSFACVVTMASALFVHLIEQLTSLNQEDDKKPNRAVSTYLLELGIVSHSMLIGLSLGVASGKQFVSLVTAITFHQFFEGVALGARIGELRGHFKPLLMVIAFSITTPLGILLGILLRHLYTESTATSTLTLGILDSISAGILIYMGLVVLVGRELSVGYSSAIFPNHIRALHLLALYLGVAAMAIVGIWA